jgi:PadR family transcriptional regulator, regulatory protein PadR
VIRRKRRLSLQAIEILAVMLEDPTADYYGLDLGKRVGVLTGTVYPLLRRLEDAGWLASAEEDIDPVAAGRPRRRLYRLTGEGERAARLECDRVRHSLMTAHPSPSPSAGMS